MDSKKIMIIDDEELLIKTLTRLLEKNGYHVYTAKNGRDAEALSQEENFDLIICDIRMPGDNGVQTITKIRNPKNAGQNQKTPVIFVTGFTDNETEQEAKKLMPISFLAKPFEVDTMLKAIKKAIG